MNQPLDVSNLRATLQSSGLVVVRGAIAPTSAAAMCECIWRVLEARGVRRDDRSTWPAQWVASFQALTRSRAFEAVGSDRVRETLDALLGGDWDVGRWGQPLVTFPSTNEWKLTSAVWHFDFPVRRSAREPVGLRLLTVLAPLASQGGGTLVLQGSHRLAAALLAQGVAGDGKSQRIRGLLKGKHPWLRELWSKSDSPDRTRHLMEEGADIDGVPLRVVEVTGEPGDVCFMHPWTLHAVSINAAKTPRFMLSTTALADRAFFIQPAQERGAEATR
jgi:hypothetical protein